MNRATPPSAEAELARRRSDIRHSLLRASTAGLVVVIVVVGLASAAVFTAVRAQRNAALAQAATAQAEEELRKSHLAQARVGRDSALMGRKNQGLAAVAEAAKLVPTLEARNEAIAHLALSDLEDTGLKWLRPITSQVVFDPTLEHFALTTNGTELLIARVDNLTPVCRHDESGLRIGRLLKFSPDGRFVALICKREPLLLVFDVEKQRPAFRAEAPEVLRGVAFTLDGTLAAFVHADHSVRVVRSANGEEVARLRPEGQPYLLHFDSAGKRLAVTVDQRVFMYDWATGTTAPPLEFAQTIHSLIWKGTVMVLGGVVLVRIT